MLLVRILTLLFEGIIISSLSFDRVDSADLRFGSESSFSPHSAVQPSGIEDLVGNKANGITYGTESKQDLDTILHEQLEQLEKINFLDNFLEDVERSSSLISSNEQFENKKASHSVFGFRDFSISNADEQKGNNAFSLIDEDEFKLLSKKSQQVSYKVPSSVPSSIPSLLPSELPTSMPTSVPTSVPSFSPFSQSNSGNLPTMEPFNQPRPLNITGIVIEDMSKRRMTIKVSLSGIGLAEVYCDALPSDKFEGSIESDKMELIDFLLQSSVYEPYDVELVGTFDKPGEVIISKELFSLVPSSNYTVFCFASGQGKEGDKYFKNEPEYNSPPSYSSTIDNALATALKVETECCRSVHFSYKPAFVYGSLSKYTNSDGSNDHIFEVKIEALPEESLIITPTFMERIHEPVDINSYYFDSYYDEAEEFRRALAANEKWTISALPASMMFSAASSLVYSSFLISAKNLPNEGIPYLQINLTLSGADMSRYLVDSHVIVNVLSDEEPPPAPKLKSARFSNSGQFFSVVFSSATNQPSDEEGSLAFNCSYLLHFNGVNLNDASCAWSSKTVVTVYPGPHATVLPSEPLTLKAGLVQASGCEDPSFDCESATNQTVLIQIAANPVVPKIALSMPAVLSNCTDLTIDATFSTGSGGRKWKELAFTVFKNNVRDNAIENKLFLDADGYTDGILKFDVETDARYNISLSLTNFFGKNMTSQMFSVFKSSSSNVPTVAIIGASVMNVAINSAFSIAALGIPSVCSRSKFLTFEWKILGKPNLFSTDPNPSRFTLSAYAFSFSDVRSTFTIQVKTMARTGETAVSYAYVTITAAPVVATIEGGYMRSVPKDQSIRLDASGSRDLNINQLNGGSATAALVYKWSCIVASGDKYGDDCGKIVNFTSSTAEVKGSEMDLSFTYLVKLSVSPISVIDSRSDTKSVLLIPVLAGSPTITMTPPSSPKFNPSLPLALDAFISCSASCNATWTLKHNVLPKDSLLTPSSRLIEKDEFPLSQSVIYPLALAPRAFSSTTGSSQFTFRITAFLKAESSKTSYTEITLTANRPPFGGVLKGSPSSGVELSTTYSLSARQWLDDADYPLSYQFFYSVDGELQSAMALGSSSLKAFMNTKLAAGLLAKNYSIALFLQVEDSLSSSTLTPNIAVRVAPIAFSLRFLDRSTAFLQTVSAMTAESIISNFLLSDLADSLSSSDFSSAVRNINLASTSMSSVDCSERFGKASCASLHRQECGRLVPNRCGPCLRGFMGAEGFEDTLCERSINAGTLTRGREMAARESQESNRITRQLASAINYSTPKKCPRDCSGHGKCTLFDPSGRILADLAPCPLSSGFCTRRCICENSYRGRDCSTSSVDLTDANIASTCKGLLIVANMTAPSSAFLTGLVSSLLSIYDPYRASSPDTLLSCLSVLDEISRLVGSGYLAPGSQSTLDSIILLLSSFTETLVVSSNLIKDKEKQQVINSIEFALASTQQGVTLGMVPGQLSVSSASENVKFAVYYALSSSITPNTPLYPPANNFDKDFNVSRPSITLPASFASSSTCGMRNNHVQFALVGWGLNPYTAVQFSSPVKGDNIFISVPVPNRGVQPSTIDSYNLALPYYSPQTEINTQVDSVLISPGIAVLDDADNRSPIFKSQPIPGDSCVQASAPSPLSTMDMAYLSCPSVASLCSNITLNLPAKGYLINSLSVSSSKPSVTYKVTILAATTIQVPVTLSTGKDSKTSGVHPAIFSVIVVVLPIGYAIYYWMNRKTVSVPVYPAEP